jgi:hypothetical protein
MTAAGDEGSCENEAEIEKNQDERAQVRDKNTMEAVGRGKQGYIVCGQTGVGAETIGAKWKEAGEGEQACRCHSALG